MSRFTVGIDLGTTNTVLSYADGEQGAPAPIHLFEVEQLVAVGEMAGRPSLPSVRYHPGVGEFKDSDIALPWVQQDPGGVPHAIVGTLARELGAQVPGRLVASAKSWLSHRAVDRTAAILPWGAPTGVPKVSPVAASASYLAHLRAAWNRRFPAHPIEQQSVVLTVPASFDDAARELTVHAARIAGLENLRLIEEPQAAFYDWMYRHREGLGSALQETRLVLVCDVGGGTTDFSLIQVVADEGGPRFTRIGVGEHLMLGGDNMDLGLAHLAEGRIAAAGARLGSGRLLQLIQQCRAAKERLLARDAPERAGVTVLGGGAQVVGGARSTELGREEVRAMVVDGFFPATAFDERPQRTRGGIVEFGLPYAADPAVTRHLAAFLAQHTSIARQALGDRAPADERAMAVPDALLLNGGVFRSAALVRRLLDVLSAWRGLPVVLLDNQAPELAVARGAVAYRQARVGAVPHIGGGAARSYFLLVDEGERKGVCVLPKGTETSQPVALHERIFALQVGLPVRFHLVSGTDEHAYVPGEVAEVGDERFTPLPPVATVLDGEGRVEPADVPVTLETELTEVGTLRVQCASVEAPARRWALAFQLRGNAEAGGAPQPPLPESFDAAAELVYRVYGPPSQKVDPKAVKRLRRDLERVLGPRNGWSMPLLRELYTVVWDGAAHRRRSPDHERVWFHLAGYCLRPGFGYPLDDWRVQRLWELYQPGVQYVHQSQGWSEWWTLWRRVAGGLGEQCQVRLFDDITPFLPLGSPGRRRGGGGPRAHGHEDMVRLAGSLERLPPQRKAVLGDGLLARLRRPGESRESWWALGRVGARQPFSGSVHNVVSAQVATIWLEAVFQVDWRSVPEAAFAAAQMARVTGDRARDLDSALRERVVQRLAQAKSPLAWMHMVQTQVELDEADEGRMFGESLPPGLKLVR